MTVWVAALGGLEQAVDGIQESIGLVRQIPSDYALEVRVKHPSHVLHRIGLGGNDGSIELTKLICLRSRISRSCSLYTQVRAVRLTFILAIKVSKSAAAWGLSLAESLSNVQRLPLKDLLVRCPMRRILFTAVLALPMT